MRRGNKAEILRNEAGLFMGVNLGADYCAEHEWGIANLQSILAVDPAAAPGIERHRIQETRALAYDPKKHIIAAPMSSWTDIIAHAERTLTFYDPKSEEIVGAWSEGDFGVRFDPKFAAEEVELWTAIQNGDAALLFMNTFDNPFARAGLAIAIISRISDEILEDLRAKHENTEKLDAADLATGIKERLAAAGLKYYALGPDWFPTGFEGPRGRLETAYPVFYFLNPPDQQKYNFGWFTVEELDQWIGGTGPILKAAK
jgi:hypothetical protein